MPHLSPMSWLLVLLLLWTLLLTISTFIFFLSPLKFTRVAPTLKSKSIKPWPW